tara:strand:+ start:2049 stop:2477 length:429 start_codon:yes stop_codon:yes gene_type:complete
MKPIKNKKSRDPRYFLNEAYGIDPTYSRDHNYGGGVHQSQMMTQEPYEEIQRQEFANEKMDLNRTTQEEEERIRDLFPGYEVIDALNHGDVTRATQTRDPNIIIPLGTVPDGAFIFAKTADDIYYRIARGYPGDADSIRGVR